jgi:hypothetical protein
MTDQEYEAMGIVVDENGDVGITGPMALFLVGSVVIWGLALIAIPVGFIIMALL